MPKTAKVKVEFEVIVPDSNIPDNQINEWLRYMLHDNGEMQLANPLIFEEIEPVAGTLKWSRK